MKKNTARLSCLAFALACAVIAAPAAAVEQRKSGANRQARDIERGRYLVMITGCNDCHTPNFLITGGKTPEQDRLVGSKLGWRGAWGTTYPPNLRLYFQGVSEEQWVQVAREIERRPPMPYFSLNAMSQADVRAIYRYINSLGPAGSPAPKFIPPEIEPPPPFVTIPSQ